METVASNGKANVHTNEIFALWCSSKSTLGNASGTIVYLGRTPLDTKKIQEQIEEVYIYRNPR